MHVELGAAPVWMDGLSCSSFMAVNQLGCVQVGGPLGQKAWGERGGGKAGLQARTRFTAFT